MDKTGAELYINLVDLSTFKRLYAHGFGDTAISVYFAIDVVCIQDIRRELGYPPNVAIRHINARMYALQLKLIIDGYSDEDIAAKCCVKKSTGVVMTHDDEPLTDSELEGIKESLEDMKAGRYYSADAAKKMLGID